MKLRNTLASVIISFCLTLSCYAASSITDSMFSGDANSSGSSDSSSAPKTESQGPGENSSTIFSAVEPQELDNIDLTDPKFDPNSRVVELAKAIDPDLTDRLTKWKDISKKNEQDLQDFENLKTNMKEAMAARGMTPEEIDREMIGFETMDRSRFRLLGYSPEGVQALDKYNQWIIDHPYAWPNSTARNGMGMCGDTVAQRHYLLGGEGADDLNKYTGFSHSNWDGPFLKSGAYSRISQRTVNSDPIAGDYAAGGMHAASYVTMPDGRSLWIAQWPGSGNISTINSGFWSAGRLTGMTSGNYPGPSSGPVNFSWMPRKLVNWRTNSYPEPSSYSLPLRV